MDKINPIGLLLVSIVAICILFLLYYSLQKYSYKPSPIKIDWHSHWDWVIILIICLLALITGTKLIFLMVVVSDSMSPEFNRGDMIITQSINTTPSIGDIITFKTPGIQTSVTHRVVRFDGQRIRTRGDNTNTIDRFQTYKGDVISKAIVINGHPIVIKNLGALFITDYSKQGALSRFGDQFTFMQNLSRTISAWGFVISILGLVLLISTIKR